MTAIKTTSLTKRFGDVSAVSDVTLTVERGEVFGFLGPNGAGKSTTINVLLDFVRRTSGTVSVLGHDPEEDPRAVRERIGVLPEASGFYGRDTARDHLEFATKMKRSDADPMALLERVGIADAADRPVDGFSKGMRQRLGIAIALVDEPDLLVLDEPLGGLDPEGARILREIVREERDRGAAVFFSSHIMDQVEAVCDRVGIMNDGELVAVDTVDALQRRTGASTTFVVGVEATPPEIGETVEALDGVERVSVREGTLRVVCTDPTAKPAVVRTLDAAGVTITDLSTDGTSLEQVFSAVTSDTSAASESRK